MNTRGKPRRKGPAGPASGQTDDKPGHMPEAQRVSEPVAFVETPERIAKLLARAGIASRREAERMITDGRVRLNGKILDTPAITATLSDQIEVDGEPLRGIERTRLWLYHKPAGLVTTHKDPEGRRTVFDNLKLDQKHVVSIGRLDINTEGLLLITNDGGLARELELPATGWLRRYRVRAHGSIDQAALDKLQDGMAVDGVLYGAIDATLDRTQASNVWITMGLREGKNREIKNVLGALGLEVNRLIRISYGPFQLGTLEEGGIQEVKSRTLRDQLGSRLIERAGANFEAPLFNEKSAGEENKKKPAVLKKQASSGADRKSQGPVRKESREDRRERDRDRLDTRKRDEKPSKRTPPRSRASNVWMGPGARPVGPKKQEAEAASRDKKAGAGRGKAKRPSDFKKGTPKRPSAKGGSRSGHADRRR
ncbi:MAG: rRNA pseudouridine synthase [Hyphomicrobiales bacterium]|nr:rRNA pseudouridine synthase [Hyphomicrobiales bacterium]MCP5000831.1 rRNA pseudouridine synthase [Hyphomicrobiales bacterium]